MMLREQLESWKAHLVTQEQSKVIQDRVVEIAEEILTSREAEYDLFLKGMVRAFREVLDWDPEVIDEESQDGEVQSGDASSQSAYQALY